MDNIIVLMEKAARVLNKSEKLLFYKDDIIKRIKKNFDKSFEKEKIESAIAVLIVSSKRELHVRKCAHKYNNGYLYMYTCFSKVR